MFLEKYFIWSYISDLQLIIWKKGKGANMFKRNTAKLLIVIIPFLIASILVSPALAILKAPRGGGGGRAEIYVIGQGSSYWG